MRILSLILSVILLVSLANTGKARMMEFDPETTIIDLEDILNIFKRDPKQTVHIINNDDSPIVIEKAEVSDKGTRQFPDLKDGVDTYKVNVRNLTDRSILSYEVTWTLKHPFEEYTFKKITANSIDVLEPQKTQKLEFRRDKYFRDDAYYYAEVTRVQFNDDESVWEAPEKDEFFTQMDAIKKQINEIDEESIDDMSKEELLEKTGAELIHGSTDTENTTDSE